MEKEFYRKNEFLFERYVEYLINSAAGSCKEDKIYYEERLCFLGRCGCGGGTSWSAKKCKENRIEGEKVDYNADFLDFLESEIKLLEDEIQSLKD